MQILNINRRRNLFGFEFQILFNMAKARLWKVCTSFIFSLVFAMLNISFSNGKKILVLSWPNGRSHFNALEKIGKELELRGHEVNIAQLVCRAQFTTVK